MKKENLGFRISLSRDYILDHANEDLTVDYQAKLKDLPASNNYAENLNTGSLVYSNDPADQSGVNTIKDHTYVYTFGLDALIDGEKKGSEDDSYETHELNKVVQRDGTYAYEETNASINYQGYQTTATAEKLAGATFGLFLNYEDGKVTGDPAAKAVSDANGHLTFTGLDVGTYYLKELQAPADYTVNDMILKIEITAELGGDGILTSYQVQTSKAADGTILGQASYTNQAEIGEDGKVTNHITRTITPVSIPDTKLAMLPSTGSQAGLCLMLSGAGMLGLAGVLGKHNRRKNKGEPSERTDTEEG